MPKYVLVTDTGIETVPQQYPGALLLVEAEPPSPLNRGYKAISTYKQQGDRAVQVWQVVPWSDQDWENIRRVDKEAVDAEQESENQTEEPQNSDTTSAPEA